MSARAQLARMVLFDKASCKKLISDQRMCTAWYHLTGMTGGGRYRDWLGWYEFIWKTNTWSGSYMNSQSKRGADKSGLGRVVESIPFSERRINGVHRSGATAGPPSGNQPAPFATVEEEEDKHEKATYVDFL